MKIVLDTNAYVRLLAGDATVAQALSRADAVYVPAVVLGELYAGFRHGAKERQNRELLERFLVKPTVSVLSVTQDTAEVYAAVMDALRKKGKPIPMNDVWIASQALETGAAVLTFDKHFSAVPGLRLVE